MESINECIEDSEAYYANREAAYKKFFGKSWSDIMDLWLVEDLTPEEAVDRLGDEHMLAYCERCKTYFLIDSDSGVYYCPYCHSLGPNSARDYEAERDARLEHEWETRNDR